MTTLFEMELMRKLIKAGNELLQQLPSSKQELLEKLDVLNDDDDVPMLSCGTDRGKITRSKANKALHVDDAVPVISPGTDSKKIIHSEEKLKKGKSSGSYPIEDCEACFELVDMHGYPVTMGSAPILMAIFAKYGDIAVNCCFKSPFSRASLLEAVSDDVRQLQASDVDINASAVKAMKSVVSDASEAKLDVTWLLQYLDKFPEEEDTECSPVASIVVDIRAAKKYWRSLSMKLV